MGLQKPPSPKSRPYHLKRFMIILSGVVLLFCLLIIQFYRIQILQGDKWEKIANNQHEMIEWISFKRGTIYSNTSLRKGHPEQPQPLALDVPKFHLYVDPDSIPVSLKSRLAKGLLSFTSSSAEEKEKKMAEFYRKSRSRKILSWIDPEKKEMIEKWWEEFRKKASLAKNAIYFVQDYKRSYPFKSLLGQVLHTVQDLRDPKTFQALPTGGLEMQFNDYLKGKRGRRLIVHSPRHSLETKKLIEPAIDGADIYLTINHYLQAIAEDELACGIKRAEAKGGWCVMMDPYSGEILAMAQYPFFDVTDYSKYFNDPKLQEHTRMKAVTDSFEPGSIFKPLTVAIALRANLEKEKKGLSPLFDPEAPIATTNGNLPGRPFPIKDGRVHKYLNVDMALQKSSNIYVSLLSKRIVDQLGDFWFKNALHQLFGFGAKTNIEVPAETPGLVPTPGKLHPNGALEWSKPTPYAIACGHNILVNAVQMVRAHSILANGGYWVEPTIIEKIVRKNGHQQPIEVYRKKAKNPKRILPKEHTERIIRSMKYVTKVGGTSKGADIAGYTQAGKSGTSEKIIDGKYSRVQYVSDFVGIAPASNPRFVLIVVVDEPKKKFIPGVGMNHLGGSCAAPIFREIARRSLHYLGVEPDDPNSLSKNRSNADWKKEVSELLDLYKKWNQ